QNKHVSLKLEKKRWDDIVVKRQKEMEESVTPDIDENCFGDLATSVGRDQERVKDRLLKNTYSKKNKRVSMSSLSDICQPNVSLMDGGSGA
ncbi:putative autism susceptibility gene 2 protein, partial [Triplophysa rosa]